MNGLLGVAIASNGYLTPLDVVLAVVLGVATAYVIAYVLHRGGRRS